MKTNLIPVLALTTFGIAGVFHGAASEAADSLAPEQCQTLYAGKTINAGSVCVTNDSTYLYATYKTTGSWYLDDLHLFVGKEYAQMPTTKTGNPQIGNFPFTIQDVDTQAYTFRIPLGDLEAASPCTTAVNLFTAAHAALVRRDTFGNVVQSETGWANGQQMNAKGSWAMYSTYWTQCVAPPPAPVVLGRCETAYAVGDMTFINLGITTSRWGWQLAVAANSAGSAPIYAGAAQNDLNKGTHVGDLYYSYSNGLLTLSYQMYPGWVMKKTHVYADNVYVTTVSPGQYGNQHELANVAGDDYNLTVSGSPAYVVAHAEACTVVN